MPTVTSEVAIANYALQKLGEAPILSLDDNDKRARDMNLVFSLVRQTLLREHHFNFSIDTVQLSKLADAPATRWACAYALPKDFVRAIAVNEDDQSTRRADFVLEGGKLLCDAEIVSLRYVRDVTDVTLYDATFVEAFACKLAMATCASITGSDAKAEAAVKSYLGLALPSAEAANDREDRDRQPWHYMESRLVKARRTSPLG